MSLPIWPDWTAPATWAARPDMPGTLVNRGPHLIGHPVREQGAQHGDAGGHTHLTERGIDTRCHACPFGPHDAHSG